MRMRSEDLIKKGRIQELKEICREREEQVRAKIESISYRLNEYVVDSLADLPVKAAKILMDDLEELHADYLERLKKLKDLEG